MQVRIQCFQRRAVILAAMAGTLGWSTVSVAVSPGTIAQGKGLFERQWPSSNPVYGGDGLGPLFNAQSCAACHHQGGIGGGGDTRFNAKTFGIESVRITGRRGVNDNVVAAMVSKFHPGFVTPDNRVMNNLPVSHHGGSPAYDFQRKAILAEVQAVFSPEGGPVDESEVRLAGQTPVLFSYVQDGYQMTLKSWVFQRNTTALFGAGLIDRVPSQLIEAVARAQRAHPEISGRPSTLKDGRTGRFGWRGNTATLGEFNMAACAVELGLESRRVDQLPDPMLPAYRNTSVDVSDQQIIALTDFVSALPAPVQQLPDGTLKRRQVERGMQVFASVGCAVCHTQSMGPAVGVYSDLLLHDMGSELIDFNPAEPYRTKFEGMSSSEVVFDRTQGRYETVTTVPGGTYMPPHYYGPSARITTGEEVSTVTGSTNSGRSGYSGRGAQGFNPARPRRPLTRPSTTFVFDVPQYPQETREVVDMTSRERESVEYSGPVVTHQEIVNDNRKAARIKPVTKGFEEESSEPVETVTTIQTTSQKVRRKVIRDETYTAITIEPTRINQEWRTAPLWGLRDSAPYMHDGRAATVLEAIASHDGESAGTRDRFLNLSVADRHAMLAFLETLVAPPTQL